MNAPTTSLATQGPLDDSLGHIFETVGLESLSDTLVGLFVKYRHDRARMREIAEIFDGSNATLLQHFAAANLDRGSYVNTERLFALEPAVRALDASYWQRTLELTDVLESMPQKRRDEWHELVRNHKTPAFDETHVVHTLRSLLAQRLHFFSERIDGIFRALSHEHVTNRPEGFSKRMIIAYVVTYGSADSSRAGTISDLRNVIARFMGRGELRRHDTFTAIEFARRDRCGEWVTLDGGALRLRVYKNGNAHLEVHPEMAWRLNLVLASLYPTAIAEEHRRRPRRRSPKDFVFYSRPLPVAVLQLLADGRFSRCGTWHFDYCYSATTSPAYREACDVLETLGGVRQADGSYAFDYLAGDVIREVVASGVLPDRRVHQYYPTPRPLAERVVELAELEPGHTVLEPSAGQGAIAELLPPDTTLVEVAELHCEILRAKGFASVVCTDFLRWKPGRRFDRILMNPPFAGGQWQRHLEHAATLLAGGGRIVAVLPAGARSCDTLPGWSCTWSAPEPFPGTSIEVVILTATR